MKLTPFLPSLLKRVTTLGYPVVLGYSFTTRRDLHAGMVVETRSRKRKAPAAEVAADAVAAAAAGQPDLDDLISREPLLLFSIPLCSYCTKATAALRAAGYTPRVVDLDVPSGLGRNGTNISETPRRHARWRNGLAGGVEAAAQRPKYASVSRVPLPSVAQRVAPLPAKRSPGPFWHAGGQPHRPRTAHRASQPAADFRRGRFCRRLPGRRHGRAEAAAGGRHHRQAGAQGCQQARESPRLVRLILISESVLMISSIGTGRELI